ncbi:hypothetical protein ACFQQB_36205 [Nonomuraea rubra]|uniref:hypothetical protein n=1 Tax=Nonomuraea rubra TaxID=46180 RepID=UPI00360E3876
MGPWRLLGWFAVIAVAFFCLYHVRTVAISIIIGVFLTALLRPRPAGSPRAGWAGRRPPRSSSSAGCCWPAR